METQTPEIFKLDRIDRKVLFWLMDRESKEMIHGWIEYIAADYKKKNIALIDAKKLFEEVMDVDVKFKNDNSSAEVL